MTIEADALTPIQSARAALQRRQPFTAIPYLMSYLSENPSAADAHELLAIAHTMSGNRQAARQSFRQATRLAPGRASAHFNYAVFLADGSPDELDEAVEETATTLFITPGHAGALDLRKRLEEKLRFRDYTADEGFALVGRGGLAEGQQAGIWKSLVCPICGGMNYVSAKVCKKCNSLIPEMDEIIPVE